MFPLKKHRFIAQIIRAYKLLLRDFAINFGVVSDMARKFADEVFHFEKRIVNSVPEHREPVILSLSDVDKLAPMVCVHHIAFYHFLNFFFLLSFEYFILQLPISLIITTTFPKLNGQTLILVEDKNLLKELSIIVSTTDET